MSLFLTFPVPGVSNALPFTHAHRLAFGHSPSLSHCWASQSLITHQSRPNARMLIRICPFSSQQRFKDKDFLKENSTETVFVPSWEHSPSSPKALKASNLCPLPAATGSAGKCSPNGTPCVTGGLMPFPGEVSGHAIVEIRVGRRRAA